MTQRDREELLKKARRGYRAALVGLALLLVGFAWGALVHLLDPDLAVMGSVFDLTSPSHLLIVSGLGLAAAGAAWWMSFLPGGGSDSRLFGRPTLLVAILGVLLLLTGGVALGAVGLFGEHEHQSGEAYHRSVGEGGRNTSTAGNSHHGGSGVVADDPVLVELKGVLTLDGTRAALDRLEELTAEDEDLHRRSHHYVHELGRFSYSKYAADANEAFSMCDRRFANGCYHGVVEAYFVDNPDFEVDDLADFCEGDVIDASATEVINFQCVHGLGHALTISFDHDLEEPLRYCDFLKTEPQQHYCYGGVFMENIMFSHRSHGQGPADREEHSIEEDSQYRCKSITDKYKRDCYILHSAAILFQNGRDIDEAFEECDKAPKPYVAACYEGMGRDIATLARWDPDESLELCALGTDSHRIWCFEGIVKVLISNDWRTDEAVEFCAGVPTWAKSRCFEGIGEAVPGLHADVASRDEECEKAKEEEWITTCRRSAGLVGSSENEML